MNVKLLTVLGGFLLAWGVAIGINVVADAKPAQAVQCEAAQCSIDSTVKSESNWKDVASQGGSGGSTGGSGGSSSNLVTYYHGCDSFLPVGGGQSQHNYPAKDSSSYSCNFNDGGAAMGQTGVVWFICYPHADRASNGRLTVFYKDPKTGTETYAFYVCLYPTDEYAPIERLMGSGKVYTGGKGDFYSVSGAVAASHYDNIGLLASTTNYVSRGVNLSNPEAYVGSWQPSFTATTATKAGQPVYSYYSLRWALDYRICNKWAYPAWLGVPARYDCSQAGTDRTANPYTYACNLNPALQAGIIPGAKFSPSQCQTAWACTFSGSLNVNGYTNPITVMRNGDPLKVNYPTPSLTTSAVQNARNWQVRNDVNAGSTPSLDLLKASWTWSAWSPWKATGNTLAFYWASDDAKTGFSFKQQYKFTGDFWVPTQSSIGGPTVYKWVTDSTTCPQVIQSPKVTVARATSGG